MDANTERSPLAEHIKLLSDSVTACLTAV